jgi:hypothetical protein
MSYETPMPSNGYSSRAVAALSMDRKGERGRQENVTNGVDVLEGSSETNFVL